MKVTVLGCGASPGVPIIGCDCAVCTSKDPRNKRSRVSVLVEAAGKRIMIDTSPDMRSQCIANNIKSIDAILYTHAHADHTHGIDDVRAFNYRNNAPIDAYMDKATEKGIKDRFSYAFLEPIAAYGWFRPCLNPIEIKTTPYETFRVGELLVTPFGQIHGKTHTLGFRIGNFAYSTDVNHLPDDSLDKLRNLDVWLVDCLQVNEAPTHAHLELTLSWIAKLKPKRAILTHMSHIFDYSELFHMLPEGVEPAYDGLFFTLDS